MDDTFRTFAHDQIEAAAHELEKTMRSVAEQISEEVVALSSGRLFAFIEGTWDSLEESGLPLVRACPHVTPLGMMGGVLIAPGFFYCLDCILDAMAVVEHMRELHGRCHLCGNETEDVSLCITAFGNVALHARLCDECLPEEQEMEVTNGSSTE